MLSIPSAFSPDRACAPALRLVLPLACLQGLAWPVADSPVALAHGPLVLQPVAGALLALVARLNPGPPRALSPGAGTGAGPAKWPEGRARPPDAQALAVVVQAPAGLALPADPLALLASPTAANAAAAWDRWLAQHAPAHRLATRARAADLVLLWCSDQTPRFALLRRGDGWARLACRAPWALPAAGTADGRYPPWLVVSQLLLPGSGLRRMHLPTGPAVEAADGLPAGVPRIAADGRASRYSRQALALTPAVLQRLQQQRVAIVGCGVEGSALASSLVRLGVAVCVIDPTAMAARHLQADLPPWYEGRPKVQALRRQLQGLHAQTTPLDGRQLQVASPAAGSLLAACDIVVAAAPGAAAQAAEAWALALLKPLLVIATAVAPVGAAAVAAQAAAPPVALADNQAWLALLPPGSGCQQCVGRWPSARHAGHGGDSGADQPALRSWSVLVANLGLRMLEHLAAGRIKGALVRHLRNGPDGSLQVRDWRPASPSTDCKRCTLLAGAGLRAAAQAMAESDF